jgi:arsenite methyltransferase
VALKRLGSDRSYCMAQDEFLDDPMPDIIEQWKFYFSVLQPERGDTIIDIGCNTGDSERLLLREYPDIREVVGIEKDQQRYEHALAKWEKGGSPAQIKFVLADAQTLPFPDGHFDRALCVETLEWVKQPLEALQEIRRVLRFGGSAVVIHSDFDTQVFNSTHRNLCRKIVNAFTDSGPNGQMGRELYGLCQKAGFQRVEPTVYTLVNTEWSPNLYANRVAHMMIDWLTRESLVPREELERWKADLNAQHSRGAFFYSINRYIYRCLD